MDFVLTHPGMNLVTNFVKCSGILTVYRDSPPVTHIQPGDNIFYDPAAGLHAFFDNISVAFQGSSTMKPGQAEGQDLYARLAKMDKSARNTQEQLIAQASNLMELCAADRTVTNSIMSNDLPFSFYPKICLNRADNSLPYGRTGDITLKVRLSGVNQCLFGVDMTAFPVNYTISNICIEYYTVPSTGKDPQCNMIVCQGVRQVINSSNSNIYFKQMEAVNSYHASFLQQEQENTATYNNLELQRPTGINKVYHQFNNSINQRISYPLESAQDMIQNYLDSWRANDAMLGKRSSNKNGCLLKALNDDQFFGIGLDFGEAIPLDKQSLGLNILSALAAGDKYYVYVYFDSILSV